MVDFVKPIRAGWDFGAARGDTLLVDEVTQHFTFINPVSKNTILEDMAHRADPTLSTSGSLVQQRFRCVNGASFARPEAQRASVGTLANRCQRLG